MSDTSDVTDTVVGNNGKPHRDDAVAAWLKRERDRYGLRDTYSWGAIDRLLDRYREKADYGLALDEDGGDP